MSHTRTELEQELVNAFIESKAVDFEAIGGIIARYGARAALTGTDLTAMVTKNFLINCGWPGPEIRQFDALAVHEGRA